MSERAEPLPAGAAGPAVEVGLGALFLNFMACGLCGIGGVLPWARRMIVERRRWLSPAEFTDLLALCQFLPGPNVLNVAVALGARFQGPPGAVVALAGVLSAPFCVVSALGVVYVRYGHVPIVAHALAALAAASSGLILATALKIAAPLRGRRLGMVLAAVTFAAVALLRLPLLPAMLVLAPLGVLLSRGRPA